MTRPRSLNDRLGTHLSDQEPRLFERGGRIVVSCSLEASLVIDLRDFWGTDRDKNAPLTSAMVEELEAALGIRLPAHYVELLRVQNGGYTRGFVFPTTQATSWAEDHVPLDALAGIGPRDPLPCGLHNLWNSKYMTEEWDLPPRQLLLHGDGHWWISLDYRSDAEPQVRWLDTELGEAVLLAPTFNAFLAGLQPESEVDPERGVLRRVD
jgi:hypothetical protein